MIIHFTTVHGRTDTRIRVKQVASLAREFPGQVALFVQDGKGEEIDASDGFAIHDTGAPQRGRLRRMTIGSWRMYRAVRRARPKIAQFHDPELLPWAILLRLQGVKVIYDMHEDLPRQLRHKDYIRPVLALPLSLLVEVLEQIAVRIFNQVIVVVPAMQSRFSTKKVTLLANFPSMAEFPSVHETAQPGAAGRFVYVGGVSRVRGVGEMVDAINLVEDPRARLHILGPFDDTRFRDEVREREGWSRVKEFGWSDRETVVAELSSASAGLVLLHPTPQYVISYPVKMFEYMAAGLPVIASDFPVWREIVEGANCGLLVDPEDPQAIAGAMQWIVDHPDEAAAMGRRGRASVERDYNWGSESSKLIKLYRGLLPDSGSGSFS